MAIDAFDLRIFVCKAEAEACKHNWAARRPDSISFNIIINFQYYRCLTYVENIYTYIMSFLSELVLSLATKCQIDDKNMADLCKHKQR